MKKIVASLLLVIMVISISGCSLMKSDKDENALVKVLESDIKKQTVTLPVTSINSMGYVDIDTGIVPESENWVVVPRTGYAHMGNYWLGNNGTIMITLINYTNKTIETDTWANIVIMYF